MSDSYILFRSSSTHLTRTRRREASSWDAPSPGKAPKTSNVKLISIGRLLPNLVLLGDRVLLPHMQLRMDEGSRNDDEAQVLH